MPKEWLEDLAQIIKEYNNPTILVGLPRRTDGREGPEAVRMRETADTIQARFPELKLEFWDERFTTTIAQQALLEADAPRSGRKQKVAASSTASSELFGQKEALRAL